jgi:hypothetical protein
MLMLPRLSPPPPPLLHAVTVWVDRWHDSPDELHCVTQA